MMLPDGYIYPTTISLLLNL